jgi:hypothetical protein
MATDQGPKHVVHNENEHQKHCCVRWFINITGYTRNRMHTPIIKMEGNNRGLVSRQYSSRSVGIVHSRTKATELLLLLLLLLFIATFAHRDLGRPLIPYIQIVGGPAKFEPGTSRT